MKPPSHIFVSDYMESKPLAKKKKTHTIKSMLANLKKREKKFKGKREFVDHDLILYGVSRYQKDEKEK